MEEKIERALLVGVHITSNVRRGNNIDINESMEELVELAKAAGAEVVGELIQNRQTKDATYFVGKGKVEEMKAKVVEAEAEVPLALAQSLKGGNMGFMDYYKMQNLLSDTNMRDSISGKDSNKSK